MPADLVVSAAVVIPGEDLSWRAVRASGPGGQHVNKVSTKVDLRFDLPGTTALSEATKARLRTMPAVRLDAEGRVVVQSQLTRNRVRNLRDARAKLAQLIRAALAAPRRRRPTRPSPAANRRRLDAKRRRADQKRARRQRRADEY